MIGERIGHFRVLSRLDRGGMSEVWLAEQETVGTQVAIKVLRADLGDDAGIQRFLNEARAAGRLQHPGTVRVFDVGVHAGRTYLVMELLRGESLSARLRGVRRLRAGAACELARQIAGALAAAHDAGITHRDLKPDNIFLVAEHELPGGERAKLLDFGIAKVEGAASPGTQGAMGTPAYMAPEQWADAGAVDWRADAYSLGCVAFELVCGRPPFIAKAMADACAMHLYDQPPAVRALVPSMPAELDALIARLLAKAPAQRGGAMREIEAAFAAIAEAARAAGESLRADAAPNDAAVPATTPVPVSRDAPTQGSMHVVPSPVQRLSTEATVPAATARTGRGGKRGVVVAAGVLVLGAAVVVMALGRGGEARRGAADAGRGAADAGVVADAVVAKAPIADAAPPDPAPIDARVIVAQAMDAGVVTVMPDAAPRQRHARRSTVNVNLDVPETDLLDEATSNKILDQMQVNIKDGCGPWPPDAKVHASWHVWHGYVVELAIEHADAEQERCIREAWTNTHFWPAKEYMGMDQSYP